MALTVIRTEPVQPDVWTPGKGTLCGVVPITPGSGRGRSSPIVEQRGEQCRGLPLPEAGGCGDGPHREGRQA